MVAIYSIVNSIAFNGSYIEPPKQPINYDRGSGAQAFDNLDVVQYSSVGGMFWDGALRTTFPGRMQLCGNGTINPTTGACESPAPCGKNGSISPVTGQCEGFDYRVCPDGFNFISANGSNGILIDSYGDDENAGYPTLCKGRFEVQGETYYALEEPTSLNVLAVLPEIVKIGVRAIKIEGRQRSPAYVAQVTRTLRAALDSLKDGNDRYSVKPTWQNELTKVSEGHQATLGAYNRPWR